MTLKQSLVNLAKLLFCGVVMYAGTLVGGMTAALLGLPLPVLPQGADMSAIGLYTMLTTPLLVFALVLIAQGLTGSFAVRALVLSFFMWIVYTVNTQLEATVVSTYATGLQFALVSGLVAALFGGTAVALFFPAETRGPGMAAAVKSYWARHSAGQWVVRLLIAAVVFMPVYFLFGLMVVPFTAEYYRQSMFGLVMPTLDTILPVLFVRSILFALACFPIFVLWQKSDRAVFWRLGTALFFFVGFVILLYATWLPLYVRLPHTLEILADEFVYAAALVLLLGKGTLVFQPSAGTANERMIA